jgi:hypothetical protein
MKMTFFSGQMLSKDKDLGNEVFRSIRDSLIRRCHGQWWIGMTKRADMMDMMDTKGHQGTKPTRAADDMSPDLGNAGSRER